MDLLFILGRPKTAITTQTVRYVSIVCFCSYCPFWYRHCVSRLISFLLTYSVQGLFEPLLCTAALNALKKARDISFSRDLPGIMTNVGPAPGPDGRRGTSYEFLWRKKSFIYFPNNEKLAAKNSITILACLQVYKVGLNARQMLRRRNRCLAKGN